MNVNASARALTSYRQTEIQSRTPVEMVVLLYERAIAFALVARDATARRDIRARRDAMSRTLAIVGELQNTLDMERGGEIAASLDRLYSYMTSTLFDASFYHDPKRVDDVITVLRTLHEGWAGIAATTAGTQQPRVT
jgi:flagellar protein FliS